MTQTETDELPPLVDPSDALERAGGRPEVASELLGILQATLPETADTLRNAHETGDLARLRDAAHRLRGATLYCGVPRLRIDATELEQLCIAEEKERIAPALQRLLTTVEATRLQEPSLQVTGPR